RHVELDDLPFIKRAVASRLDRAEMHEDVLAGLRGDKAKALLGVEPLHGSNRHVLVPPSVISEVSINARDRSHSPLGRGAAPTPAPRGEAGWTCGVSQRMLPSPNGGSLCATRSVPSSSRSI